MAGPSKPCPAGKLWDIYWHDGPTTIFVNEVTSSPCQLVLTESGSMLEGSFQCAGLVRFQGQGSLNVLEGSFSCTLAP